MPVDDSRGLGGTGHGEVLVVVTEVRIFVAIAPPLSINAFK